MHVLFTLFSYHNPWSAEELPDPANSIFLGPDTTGREGDGGSPVPSQKGGAGGGAGPSKVQVLQSLERGIMMVPLIDKG